MLVQIHSRILKEWERIRNFQRDDFYLFKQAQIILTINHIFSQFHFNYNVEKGE